MAVKAYKRKTSNRITPSTASVKLRVAAYCRVSTDTDEQDGSLESQEGYYINLISERSDWICAGIFSDKGSGCNIKHRPAFVELMQSCQKKKIDLILTKSISRLGRNTLEIIKTMRILQALDIDVWFDIEGMRLLDRRNQETLEILGAVAQAESKSKSIDIRWGIQRSFQNIDSKISHFTCYGYKHDANGHLFINEAEAKVVLLIFNLRAERYSLRKISAELMQRKIPSPTGNTRWSAATLDKLLSNEKYIGDVMLQKTFVEDFLSGVQVKNTGQRSKFLISNHHEAIVDKEIWDVVQASKWNQSKAAQMSVEIETLSGNSCGSVLH